MATFSSSTPLRFLQWPLLLAATLGCAACGGGSTPDPTPASDAGADAGLSCEGSGVSKGPWALRVDRTSAVVRWETCRAGVSNELSFTPEAGGGAKSVTATESSIEITETRKAALDPTAAPDEAGTYYMHEAALSGLEPGACYHYKLAADESIEGRVCAAKSAGQDLRFMAIADTNPGLNGITGKLLEQVLPQNPDFTIHAGDIQYYDSGLETWASWFPKMRPMLTKGAIFPAVGNHELEQPEELEAYYKRFFGGAGFDGNDAYYRFESAGVWFFSLDTEQDISLASDQGVWLAKQLADAAANTDYRFTIVFFHKPWVTCGDKSQDSSARAAFLPLFTQHGVKLVVQAHMHAYERFEMDGITWLTTGGGGGSLGNPDENIDRPECAMRVASGAFRHAVLLDVKTAEVAGTVIDETGATRDSFTTIVP